MSFAGMDIFTSHAVATGKQTERYVLLYAYYMQFSG